MSSLRLDGPVVFLGAEGAGKTCLNVAMYQELRLGKANFTVSAQQSSDDKAFTRTWNSMRTGQGPGRYPQPTNALHFCGINLNFAAENNNFFILVDPPGAAVSADDSEKMRVELGQVLEGALGVLVCLPCDQLLNYVDDSSEALDALVIGDINQLLAELYKPPNVDERPAIVVVATKFDLFIQKVNEGRDKQLWDSLIKGYFPEFTELDHSSPTYKLILLEAIIRDAFPVGFAPGGGWKSAIVPVSLGMALAEAPETARLRVENVHLPLLYINYVCATVNAKTRDYYRNSRDNAERAMPKDLATYENGVRKSGVSF